MSASIRTRLKASKKECDERMFDDGLRVGREWAEETTSYEDLRLLAAEPIEGTISDVAAYLDCDVHELVGDEALRLQLISPMFAEGFIAGALQLFTENFDIMEECV